MLDLIYSIHFMTTAYDINVTLTISLKALKSTSAKARTKETSIITTA